MVSINEFINNNENQRVIISSRVPGDCLVEDLYDGMLHDIPDNLRNVMSYTNGWSFGNGCPVIYVHPEEL